MWYLLLIILVLIFIHPGAGLASLFFVIYYGGPVLIIWSLLTLLGGKRND